MKTLRMRWNSPKGYIVVRYYGQFRCICGGRTPFIDNNYSVTELTSIRSHGMVAFRGYIRSRRKQALETLEAFALTSELCHDGETNE